MNEGESAGGGHQGPNPAPPAVLDRRSPLPNLNSIINRNNSQTRAVSPLVTGVDINTSLTVGRRSYHQAFPQQQQQQPEQSQQLLNNKITNAQTGVALQQKQKQPVHMPQTPSLRFSTAGFNSHQVSQPSGSVVTVGNTKSKEKRIELESIDETPPSSKRSRLEPITDSVVGSANKSNVLLSLLPTTEHNLDAKKEESSAHTKQYLSTIPPIPDNTNIDNLLSEFTNILVESFTENVFELYAMVTDVVIMDETFREKPIPQLITFRKANSIELLIKEEKSDLLEQQVTFQQTSENIANTIGASNNIHVQQQLQQIKRSESPAATSINKTNSSDTHISTTAQTTIGNNALTKSGITTTRITDDSNNALPQGAEIKIPAVGATPVAVSTKLPAAVVQLSQQGGTPLVPCTTGVGSSALRRSGDTTLRTSSIGVTHHSSVNSLTASIQSPTTIAPAGSTQEVSFKAKQEVYVMQRVSELQREGLWTEKRLPKLQEPCRPRVHWDYLLEEMVWLAADFAQERKWKKAAAKKCAKMVQKYFNDKANAAQKAEKARELHLKRIAGYLAKEVKIFWTNVEKIVKYKLESKLEEKRKEAFEDHLSFIVNQSEKFSQHIAEDMNKSILDSNAVSAGPSINSSRISSPKRNSNMSDGEFCPDSGSEDDEETIAKAEEEAVDVHSEVAALEKESQMDLDDFLNDLPPGYLENRNSLMAIKYQSSSNEESSDDEEDTIAKQGDEEMEIDYKEEINDLEAENNLSVNDLLEKYKSVSVNKSLNNDVADSDDDENSEHSDFEDHGVKTDEQRLSECEDPELKSGLKSLLEDMSPKDYMTAAALAESLQPQGNTYSSTNVVTPVPFLLKHSLREYQHIGLDWLVTMNERKLNGILADEMGLGKTIQTIALLAHLACVKGNWGPHLIVVPSSVMLNWEMEFKKWCPGFKILTYYGAQKERKSKRIGWTKPNAFHVCITSYKLVVQDQQSFRRKKWKYLILDEAQNIKNYNSQRWQLLLNFSTERRLLLTGTPLQNHMMELWSLMHFLMPAVFSSHRAFKEWFSNPLTGIVEGNAEYNEVLISRLHKVIRPFLLRRLKKEVEKQMPKKYEHVVACRLSNRQRYLYDDFMSRAKTKETLQTGNLLSVINVLMQLRKVCNHPNLFEVRPTNSPFQMEGISYQTAGLVSGALEYDPLTQINLYTLNLLKIELEQTLTAYVSHKCRLLAPPRKLIEEIDAAPEPPPPCPKGEYRFYVRIRDSQFQESLTNQLSNGVRVGASPAMKTEGNKIVPIHNMDIKNSKVLKRMNSVNPINTNISLKSFSYIYEEKLISSARESPPPPKIPKLIQTKGNALILSPLAVNETATTSKVATAFKTNKISINENASNSGTVRNETIKLVTDVVKIKEERSKISTNEEKEILHANNIVSLTPTSRSQKLTKVRKELRSERLKLMASVNKRRTDAFPIYGSDLRESLEKLLTPTSSLSFSSWQTRGYSNCNVAAKRLDNWSLNKLLKSYETRCNEFGSIFDNFVVYVPPVCAPRIRFYVQNPCSRVKLEDKIENTITRDMSRKLAILHPIISAMRTQFPDPRLIQYDCGKLQTLDLLLKQLKSEQHRVLIFTQMTKMLDVLEAFLNYHGHIYLRLDGSTRIDQRQALMERFNGDKKIFCFILSTRSGGVGVNLTGADTVIFYDSDWNPTMDAQAQDRCHRIGQTRDVHIYRLVSEKTIEVNILKKANQKRMLSDMAIEGGNFTTTFLKSSTIKDLFNLDQNDKENENASKQEKVIASTSGSTNATETQLSNEGDTEKQSLRAFEDALAAAEDEQDVKATKIVSAEVAADLAEFDETVSIAPEAVEGAKLLMKDLSKADMELQNLENQLSPIERYAVRFVEQIGDVWSAEQLRAAEEQIEAKKREWEANSLAALQKEEEMLKQEAENDEMLTYNRKDSSTDQIWMSRNSMEQMPMWCPPTPPQDENDIYVDYSLSFMYEIETIPDIDLPPIYVKREYKRSRAEAGLNADGRRSTKIRKEDNYYAPRSLFDKPSTAIARIRRDLKSQRHRGVFKPNVQVAGLKPQVAPKPITEPDCIGEWSILEDLTILNVLINIQGLPCNLMVLSPGHTPNWDLVAEIVNSCTRTHRSAKQIRWRYETVIQPREEGKAGDSPKKQKKMKNAIKVDYLKGPLRYLRTTQLFINDNNMSFTKMMRSRFDCIKAAYLKKAPPPKRHFSNPTTMNPKHLEVLQELGVTSYDQPICPLNIAAMKVNKYREKQRSHLPPPPPPTGTAQSTHQQQVAVPTQTTQTTHTQQQQQIASVQHQLAQANQQQQIQELVQQQSTVTPSASAQLHTQQLQIQHISNAGIAGQQQSTATAIVLQHAGNLSQQLQQQTSITNNAVQNQTQVLRGHSGAAQIVKAIVAQPSGLIATSQMLAQQNTTTGTQHVQLQPTSSGNLVGAPASVSVVLTTPVQTLSSNVQQSHHTQQSSIVSNSTQVGSIVQTLPQSIQQVVPVSQLANVGTVLTTSSNLQPSGGTVTSLNTSTLRAQRIVAATSGTLQDVVLQQRSGNPSPTIVSMPNLGQNVTPAQFQAAQLRLAASMSSGSQQVVAKSIPVSSLQQTAKLTPTSSSGNQQAHIQLYRQRQGVKVLQSSSTQGTQSVQTAGGQAALLNAAGTIIQGNIMQASSVATAVQVQGQKVAVASVPSSSVVTTPSGATSSVAAVQVTHGSGRTQFIKQVAGKQTIRQVGETDMLVVKRQVIGSHTKTQVLQQGQIFASGSTVGGVQIQQNTQATSTGNVQSQSQAQAQPTQVQQITPQQIATLVKTSSGASASGLSGVSVATGGQPQTVNMALSQLKPGGQIKVTMANQSQMRQLHMQQQLGIPRKINRMTQIAPGTQVNAAVASNQQGNNANAQLNAGASITTQKSAGSVQAQLLHIQNSKALPSSVTVQQIQQVMRQGQQGSLTTTGLVLGKTSVGRVIPVSVASQPNQRQIQVVSATSAQAIAANNIRAQVASGQIKVAPGSSQSQTQQALITAIQQQAVVSQGQRHASPVRIQTTASGNLVAVVQQQTLQQQQSIVASNMSANVGASNTAQEVLTINQGTAGNVSSTQQQTTVQQPTTQQVRTLVKKKIMQIRSEKD